MSYRIITGDALERLRELPDESVHCVVTSPPYWGLRDYGTGTWEGGDPECDHTSVGGNCRKCGAVRQDLQIGLEDTPDAWCARLVEVFREVRRVLRSDGVFFLNIGDSYAGSWGNQGRKEERGQQRPINGEMLQPVHDGRYPERGSNTGKIPEGAGLKPKDLVGQPWMLAFALRADGWYLRADCIWAKPNPMPESVRDRPTKAHEYVFVLTKSARYFWDAEAVREGLKDGADHDRPRRYVNGERGVSSKGDGIALTPGRAKPMQSNPAGRNLRSVWTLATEPYGEAHFATFPTALASRCILAGTSAKGVCPDCGAPWVRVVERERVDPHDYNGKHSAMDPQFSGRRMLANVRARREAGQPHDNPFPPPVTTGWRPSCSCDAGEPVQATVLDPFAGAATTMLAAEQLDRDSVGIELSPIYAEIAEKRLARWRSDRALGRDAPRVPALDGQLSLLGDAP